MIKTKPLILGYDLVLNVLSLIGQVIIALQVITVSADVISRSLFSRPIYGVIGFNEWSLLYIAFMGFAWSQRDEGLVKLEMFSNLSIVKPQMKLGIELMGYVIGVFVSIILLWRGSIVVWDHWLGGYIDYFKIHTIPLYIILTMIPLGALFLLVQNIRDFFDRLKTNKNEGILKDTRL